MWVPVAGLPPRLALSAFSGAGRFCILRSGAARWKDVPARNRRGLSDFQPQLLPSECFGDLPAGASKCRFEPRRYILSPRLAKTVVRYLLKQDNCKMVLEFNPGESVVDCIFLDVHHFCKPVLTTRGLLYKTWSLPLGSLCGQY